MNKSRILWIALIFSLAMNVFFVGGALYFRHMAGSFGGEGRALEHIAELCDLLSACDRKEPAYGRREKHSDCQR